MCFYDLGVPFFVPFGVAVSKRRFLDRCEEGIALLSLYFTLCASIGPLPASSSDVWRLSCHCWSPPGYEFSACTRRSEVSLWLLTLCKLSARCFLEWVEVPGLNQLFFSSGGSYKLFATT